MRSRLVLLVASLALSLVVVEAGLRWVRPLWAIAYPPVCPLPEVYQRWDPYGYRLWPSRTTPHRYASRTVTLVSNADGFRGARDLHARDARVRIVALGDSMVFGEGVEEAERLTEVLEAVEPGWRVDNLGMVGFGPDLMLRALEAVGLDPPPDAVVFAIFTDDPRRVVLQYQGPGFPLPRLALDAGRLVTVPYPVPRPWDRSRLLQGMRYLRWRYTGATFPLNAAILDRFLALAEDRRFAPAIVFLPGRRDGWDDRMRRRWLRGYAEGRRVPFLDLTEALQAAGPARVHIPGDSHWNPVGHAVVARELHPFLAEVLSARR